jgi:hypothetical protein
MMSPGPRRGSIFIYNHFLQALGFDTFRMSVKHGRLRWFQSRLPRLDQQKYRVAVLSVSVARAKSYNRFKRPWMGQRRFGSSG